MPFVIHAKDSGAPVRGLTAGLLQGMELRRQWDKDKLLEKEEARKERLSLLQEQIHEKDLLIKGAAARKVELENQQTEGRMGYATRKAEHLKGLKKGPGVRGKLDMPSGSQQSIMAAMVKNGVDIAGLDTQFQGVAVHPVVVQAMENAWHEAQFEEAEWAKLDPTKAAEARKKWYVNTAGELQHEMKRAERQLIDKYFADPMMQPGDDIGTRHLHFDGIAADNWNTYRDTYRDIKTKYDNGGLSHSEVLNQLEDAENQLFQDLYQDTKSDEMTKDLEEHGVKKAAQMATHLVNDETGSIAATPIDIALSEAYEDWEAANKIDGSFNKKADAYLALMGAWNAKSSGLESSYLQKRRDQMVMGANAEEQRKRYQNTIKYLTDPKMKAAYQAAATELLKTKLEGGKTYDRTMLGDVIAEMETEKGLMGLDYDVYSEFLNLALEELGYDPVTGEPDVVSTEEEEDRADMTLSEIRTARVKEGLEKGQAWDKIDPQRMQRMNLGSANRETYQKVIRNRAAVAYNRTDGTAEEKRAAAEKVFDRYEITLSTIPKSVWKNLEQGPESRVGLVDKFLTREGGTYEKNELYNWLTDSNQGDMSPSAAKDFIARHREKLRDVLTPLIREKYGDLAGLYDSEWASALTPIISADFRARKAKVGAPN